MRIKPDHEKERQMVCVPERLKALLANLVMSSCVHDKHDQKHEVARDAARLRVMDL